MSITLDLYLNQGADFLAILPCLVDYCGNPIDLTGYSATSQVRRSYSTVNALNLTATIPDPLTGVIQLSLPASQTMGLTPTRYLYDVLITDSNQIVTRVFEGLVIVNPGITNTPNTIFYTPYVPDDFGGSLE